MTRKANIIRTEIKGGNIPNWTVLREGDSIECAIPDFCVSTRFNASSAATKEFLNGVRDFRRSVEWVQVQICDWIEHHSGGLGHA